MKSEKGTAMQRFMNYRYLVSSLICLALCFSLSACEHSHPKPQTDNAKPNTQQAKTVSVFRLEKQIFRRTVQFPAELLPF